MVSAIGHLRGDDLGAYDDRQLGEDQVGLGDVLGSVSIGEIAEGLTILNATDLDEQGVDLFLAGLEQGFELGGDIKALGGSGGNLGDSRLEVLGLLRGVDAGHNLRSEHTNRFGDAPSAEHCRRILGPPGAGFGGEQASELRILGGEADLAGVAVVGEERGGGAAVELLPEYLATTGTVSGEHGIGAHAEGSVDDVVLALEVEGGLLLGGALPRDEFSLFDLGASQHAAGSNPLAHLLDGGYGVLDLAVHLRG